MLCLPKRELARRLPEVQDRVLGMLSKLATLPDREGWDGSKAKVLKGHLGGAYKGDIVLMNVAPVLQNCRRHQPESAFFVF